MNYSEINYKELEEKFKLLKENLPTASNTKFEWSSEGSMTAKIRLLKAEFIIQHCIDGDSSLNFIAIVDTIYITTRTPIYFRYRIISQNHESTKEEINYYTLRSLMCDPFISSNVDLSLIEQVILDCSNLSEKEPILIDTNVNIKDSKTLQQNVLAELKKEFIELAKERQLPNIKLFPKLWLTEKDKDFIQILKIELRCKKGILIEVTGIDFVTSLGVCSFNEIFDLNRVKILAEKDILIEINEFDGSNRKLKLSPKDLTESSLKILLLNLLAILNSEKTVIVGKLFKNSANTYLSYDL